MILRNLHALSSLDPAGGGPVAGVHQLTKRNVLLGLVVELVTLDDHSASWFKNISFRVHALSPAKLGIYGCSSRYVPRPRERAHNYDCVTINGIWDFNTYYIKGALRKTKEPYVVFAHGMPVLGLSTATRSSNS